MSRLNEYNPEFGVVFEEPADQALVAAIQAALGGGGAPQQRTAYNPATGNIEYQQYDPATGKWNWTGVVASRPPAGNSTTVINEPLQSQGAYTKEEMDAYVAERGGKWNDAHTIATFPDRSKVKFDPIKNPRTGQTTYNPTAMEDAKAGTSGLSVAAQNAFVRGKPAGKIPQGAGTPTGGTQATPPAPTGQLRYPFEEMANAGAIIGGLPSYLSKGLPFANTYQTESGQAVEPALALGAVPTFDGVPMGLQARGSTFDDPGSLATNRPEFSGQVGEDTSVGFGFDPTQILAAAMLKPTGDPLRDNAAALSIMQQRQRDLETTDPYRKAMALGNAPYGMGAGFNYNLGPSPRPFQAIGTSSKPKQVKVTQLGGEIDPEDPNFELIYDQLQPMAAGGAVRSRYLPVQATDVATNRPIAADLLGPGDTPARQPRNAVELPKPYQDGWPPYHYRMVNGMPQVYIDTPSIWGGAGSGSSAPTASAFPDRPPAPRFVPDQAPAAAGPAGQEYGGGMGAGGGIGGFDPQMIQRLIAMLGGGGSRIMGLAGGGTVITDRPTAIGPVGGPPAAVASEFGQREMLSGVGTNQVTVMPMDSQHEQLKRFAQMVMMSGRQRKKRPYGVNMVA